MTESRDYEIDIEELRELQAELREVGETAARMRQERDVMQRDLADTKAALLRMTGFRDGAEKNEKDALAEVERLRLLAKRFANAVFTGQRYEGLICQAEDFLGAAEQSAREEGK